MSKLFWDWSNFTGGEADDVRQGPQNSVQEAIGVNLRSTLGEVHLGAAMIDTGWIFTGQILLIENLNKFGGNGVLVTTDTGNVYINGVLKFTFPTSNFWGQVSGLGYLNVGGIDYLYFITHTISGVGKIHRSLLNGTGLIANYRTFTVNSGGGNSFGKLAVISEPTRIIFGIGNTVFHLDSVETVIPKITLSPAENIIGITNFLNRYRIYVNIGGEKGIQYFWDGATLLWDYKTNWEHTPVLGVTNDGSIDYAITGYNTFYSNLYRISGVQKSIYHTNKEAGNGRHFSQFISSRQGIFYISGITNSSATKGVYTLGNDYINYPETLSLEHISIGGEIYGHAHSVSQSYFSCVDGKVYKVSHNSPISAFNAQGHITSLIFNGGKNYKYIKKQIDYAYVGLSGVSNLAPIEIFARVDGGIFKLLKTLNIVNNNARSVRIDRTEFIAQSLGDFIDLEYKIVMHSNGSYAPIFRGIETYFTANIKK